MADLCLLVYSSGSYRGENHCDEFNDGLRGKKKTSTNQHEDVQVDPKLNLGQ